MTFTRDQRNRTFDALQTIALEDGKAVDRDSLERVFDAAERGERAAIVELETANGVIANWLSRHTN